MAARRAKEDPTERVGDVTEIKRKAIEALATMNGAGTEPLEWLIALSTREALSAELKAAAGRAAARGLRDQRPIPRRTERAPG